MKRGKKAVISGCLALFLCQALYICVVGETLDPVKTETDRTQAETQLLNSWEEYGGFFHEGNFSSDHYLNGLFSQCTEYFNTGDWELHGAALIMRYATTQLLVPEVSSLTVSINDQPVYSATISPTGGAQRELVIPIPVSAIKINAPNSVVISVYLRGDAPKVCADDLSGTQWMNIFKDSKLLVSYTPLSQCRTIAEFYSCFTSIDALENTQSAVYLPTDAGPAALTAAALTLSGTSGSAVLDYERAVLRQTDNPGELDRFRYAVYIAPYDRLPAALQSLLTESEDAAARAGAVLSLQQLGDSRLLILTGSSEQELKNAGRLLANPAYVKQLDTQTKTISGQTDFIITANIPAQYLPLTEYGVKVTGSFRQSAEFFIDYPANRTIAPSSELSLDLRYSENLRFDRSLVTVYINDIPIGSKRLRAENAKGDTAVFTFPADLQLTGGFSVKVAFDLDAGEDWCRQTPEEMPWGFVSETSMLKLSSTDSAALVFENFPSPFLRDGSLNNAVIVLPKAYGQPDLDAMRMVTLTLGRFLKDNAGGLEVVFDSAEQDYSKSNLISIGRFEQNNMARQQADNLYFRFDSQGAALVSNEKMSISPEYGRRLGTAQLLDSPYSKQPHALLIITGATDEAMLRAARFLGSADTLWRLTGDGYAADDQSVQCYVFKHSKAAQPEPDVARPDERQSVYSFAIVAAAVVSLCLLAVILFITKYARRTRS